MSFQSTLNSSLVPDLALPNGLQYIVDNDRSDGLAGQILSSNNGGGLLWINGGGSGGGNVSTNTNNDFTANNTFSDNGATQAEFIVSTGKTIFTTQPLFEAGLNVLDGIVTFQTQVSFDDIILDNGGSSGLSGQVLTAGTGGQVIWGAGGSGGGDVYLAGDNVYTGTNQFTTKGIICNSINSTTNTGALQVIGSALGVSNGGLTSAILVGAANTNIFTSSTTPLMNGTSCNISVQDNTGATVECFDFNAITNQSTIPFLFNSSIYDNNGDTGIAGQVLTAGTGSQVVWGAGGSGGGNVSTGTVNTFTETNIFNNNVGAGVQLQVNVPSFFTESITGNLTGNISGTSGIAVAVSGGTAGDVLYQTAASSTAGLAIGTAGQVLTVAGGIPSWATPASGGGDVYLAGGASAAAPQTFTGYNKFNNALSVNSITPSTGQLNLTCGAIEMINAPTQLSLTINQETLEFQVSNSVGDPTSIILEVFNDIGLGVQAMNISYTGINLGVPLTTSYIYADFNYTQFIGYQNTNIVGSVTYIGGIQVLASYPITSSGIWTFCCAANPCNNGGISLSIDNGSFNQSSISSSSSTSAALSLSLTQYMAAGQTMYFLYTSGNLTTISNVSLISVRVA